MVAVRVKSDIRRMTRDLSRVQKRIVPQVASQAINRAAAGVRTASVRETSGVKSVRQKLIRPRITIAQRASRRRLTAVIRVRGYPLPVVLTGNARQTKKGVRVGRRSIVGAFVATGKRGLSVFKRKGRPRLPIQEQTIDLAPEIYVFTKRNVKTVGAARFRTEFSRSLKYRLNKRARR